MPSSSTPAASLLCQTSRGILLALLLLNAAPALAQHDSPDATDPFCLRPSYNATIPEYQQPYAAFNGKEVLYTDGAGITARDPKTGLVRWQGGELKHLRELVDRDDHLLLIGEHVQLLEKDRGKVAWDFPLNCFPGKGQCNADVMDRTNGQLVIGGFGQRYNMVTLLDLATGKEAWPSWLTACHFTQARVVNDSLVLVCDDPGMLLQTIELKSRRTLFTAPSPNDAFKPETLWASANYLFIDGLADGKRKLFIFKTTDGSLVRKFNVKSDAGGAVGFRVAPEAGRFVPWQRKGEDLLAWGMDVESGKVAWSARWEAGRIVGQQGSILVVAGRQQGEGALLGIDLVEGNVVYHHALPTATFETLMLNGRVLLRAGGNRFLVLEALTGAVAFLGRLAAEVPLAREHFYFAPVTDRFVTLAQQQVTLYERTSLADRTRELGALLDEGRDLEAQALFESLIPFRDLVPAIAGAYYEIMRFRWLQAESALRAGELTAAIELARENLPPLAAPNAELFIRFYPSLARFALETALHKAHDDTADAFVKEVLWLLLAHLSTPAFYNLEGAPDKAILVDLAVALASGMVDESEQAEGFDVLRRMHGLANLAAPFEANPYWTLFLVSEVATTLEAADEAQKIGEYALSADLLHDLTDLPMAAQLFGSTFDPWLDAQGVHLLPPDLQAMKLPDLLNALNRKLAGTRKSVLAESRQQVCERTCTLAGELCPGRCVLAESCRKAENRCRQNCTAGRARFQAPAFSVARDEPAFNRCR